MWICISNCEIEKPFDRKENTLSNENLFQYRIKKCRKVCSFRQCVEIQLIRNLKKRPESDEETQNGMDIFRIWDEDESIPKTNDALINCPKHNVFIVFWSSFVMLFSGYVKCKSFTATTIHISVDHSLFEIYYVLIANMWCWGHKLL